MKWFERITYRVADRLSGGALTKMAEREAFEQNLKLLFPEHAEEIFKIVLAIEATRPFAGVRTVVMQMVAHGTLHRDELRYLIEHAPAACWGVASPSKMRELEGTDSLAFLRRVYAELTA